MPTLTLKADEDFTKRITEAAARVGESRSEYLRKAAEMRVSGAPSPEKRQIVQAAPPAPPQAPVTKVVATRTPATKRAARASVADKRATPCNHPINRRIGKTCVVCGQDVAK